MKKYEGYMLCSDMDGTLLGADHLISEENRRAIAYFMSEGGVFTVATGRTPVSIHRIFSEVTPNAPIVTHNGAAIYNLSDGAYVKTMPLGSDAIEVVEYVEENFGYAGFEIYDHSDVYFYKVNDSIDWHVGVEYLRMVEKDYRAIARPWTKVMFVQTKEETVRLREALRKTPYWDKYSFIKSSSIFLELLDRSATKGNAMLDLKKMLGIHTAVCVGDNENDISLLKAADISYAVDNAIDELKSVADRITVGNSDHAIAKVIEEISV